jgi:uncharacterized membrane protein
MKIAAQLLEKVQGLLRKAKQIFLENRLNKCKINNKVRRRMAPLQVLEQEQEPRKNKLQVEMMKPNRKMR